MAEDHFEQMSDGVWELIPNNNYTYTNTDDQNSTIQINDLTKQQDLINSPLEIFDAGMYQTTFSYPMLQRRLQLLQQWLNQEQQKQDTYAINWKWCEMLSNEIHQVDLAMKPFLFE